MAFTKAERETTIVFSDAGKVAEIYTAQRRMITKLSKNPAARLIESGRSGTSPWARFEIDPALITFRSKRRSRTAGSGRGFDRRAQGSQEAPKAS